MKKFMELAERIIIFTVCAITVIAFMYVFFFAAIAETATPIFIVAFIISIAWLGLVLFVLNKLNKK